jgi:hypothetical protein
MQRLIVFPDFFIPARADEDSVAAVMGMDTAHATFADFGEHALKFVKPDLHADIPLAGRDDLFAGAGKLPV